MVSIQNLKRYCIRYGPLTDKAPPAEVEIRCPPRAPPPIIRPTSACQADHPRAAGALGTLPGLRTAIKGLRDQSRLPSATKTAMAIS